MDILQLSKEYQAKAEENARLLEEKVKVTEQQNIQLTQAKQDADIARHEALAANESKGKFLAHMSSPYNREGISWSTSTSSLIFLSSARCEVILARS